MINYYYCYYYYIKHLKLALSSVLKLFLLKAHLRTGITNNVYLTFNFNRIFI